MFQTEPADTVTVRVSVRAKEILEERANQLRDELRGQGLSVRVSLYHVVDQILNIGPEDA